MKPSARTLTWYVPAASPSNRKRPSAPELADEVLRPIADALEREIAALDRIARADPATAGMPTGPARESRTPYPVQPAPPQRDPHPSMPKHDPGDDLVRVDQQWVDAQLAALGFTRETVPPLVPREPVRKEKP